MRTYYITQHLTVSLFPTGAGANNRTSLILCVDAMAQGSRKGEGKDHALPRKTCTRTVVSGTE